MIERRINVKLKILLLEKGLTQRQLSQKTGIPEQLISMLVRGQYVPSDTERTRISDILEVEQNRIFR